MNSSSATKPVAKPVAKPLPNQYLLRKDNGIFMMANMFQRDEIDKFVKHLNQDVSDELDIGGILYKKEGPRCARYGRVHGHVPRERTEIVKLLPEFQQPATYELR